MPLFEWNDSYSVGITEMDNEHKKLFAIINELFDGLKAGKGRDILDGIFKELKEYTRVHFNDEEILMKRYDYPGLEEQKKQHVTFIDKIRVEENKSKGGAFLVSIEILGFLRDWLTTHIQKYDREYGEFIREKSGK